MRFLALVLFCSVLFCGVSFYGVASAQVGLPPAQLLQKFSPKPAKTAQGYSVDGVAFTLTGRGGALYGVAGDAVLNPKGQAALAQLVGAATGYGAGLTGPITEFLQTRAAELAGRGEVAINVEEFVLTLAVTGEAAPYRAAFSLNLAQTEGFPPSNHTLGPKDAKVVIREFSDFQCPFCAQYSAEVLPELKKTLLARGDVRFEYHYLPLTSIHANALLAAEAAECVTAANTPQAFWTYHDALFGRQKAWAGLGDAAPYFVRLAREVGLSNEGVAACLADGRYTRKIQSDLGVATQQLGVNSTPSVFVGPYRVPRAGDLSSYDKAISRLEAFTR